MPGPLRVFVSAGDTSGDAHAAELVHALRRQVPDATFEGFGGRALADAGVRLFERLADHPVMGFAKVLPELGRFVGLLNGCDRRFAAAPPDVVLPVDYPGFNVRLALLARRRGIKVCYHVVPQYWAWAPWRVRRLVAAIDLGLVTLPFEADFFGRAGMRTCYIGHPLADRFAALAPAAADARTIGLVPGSRRREIEANLPWQLAAAAQLQQALGRPLTLAAVHPEADRRALIADLARAAGMSVAVSGAPLPELLAGCRFAFVTSGTATLEAALLRVPAVVVYRITPFMRRARPYALLAPWVALPNLLCARELFPEFVTDADPTAAMAAAARALHDDGPVRTECLAELEALRRRILVPGIADRAATAILAELGRAVPAATSR